MNESLGVFVPSLKNSIPFCLPSHTPSTSILSLTNKQASKQAHPHISPLYKQGWYNDLKPPKRVARINTSALLLQAFVLCLPHRHSPLFASASPSDSVKMSPTSHDILQTESNGKKRVLSDTFLLFSVAMIHPRLSISAREWLNEAMKSGRLNNSSAHPQWCESASKAWKCAGSCGGVSLERLLCKTAFQLPFVPHNFQLSKRTPLKCF